MTDKCPRCGGPVEVALDEEHKEYGKPLVRAIQEEIKEARASFDSARTVAEPGTNIPDAPS